MNYTMPYFSIITVNLNNAEGLRKTITSVISQTFTEYEYIIIDGGSTDGSVEVIKDFAAKITHWTSEADNGIYHAMNKGLRQSKGEIITFLNSGDEYIAPISLEIAAGLIKKKHLHAGLFFFDYIFHSEEHKKLVSSNDVTNKYKIYIKGFGHPSTFYMKKILETNGGFDESFKISADRNLYMKMMIQDKLAFSYFPFAVSVFNKGGISTDINYKNVIREEDRRIINKYYSTFEKKIISLGITGEILSIKFLGNFIITLLNWNLNRI